MLIKNFNELNSISKLLHFKIWEFLLRSHRTFEMFLNWILFTSPHLASKILFMMTSEKLLSTLPMVIQTIKIRSKHRVLPRKTYALE
jgi:hypothetical protein